MKKISALLLLCSFITASRAQQFLDKGVIEYEVKANIRKTMGNNVWDEMRKDLLPEFKTGYYTLTFADNKSVYKWDHWDEKMKLPEYMRRDDEVDSWFADYNNNKLIAAKTVIGSMFNISDSLQPMDWRITNESRVIAGFNCRKAVTKIFDSVYVFAFYTDEILLSGGPCSFHGLPGTIMGLTIPRLYTSWIAVKVSVNGVQTASIKPVEAKKYYTNAMIRATIDERTKDWWNGEDSDENRQQKNRFIWSVML